MAKTSDKQTFIMSKTWLTTMDALPDAALNKLTRAIIAYQMGNEVVIDDPVIEAIFKGYREFFIENEKKYKEQCERNSQIAKDRLKGNEPSPVVTSRDESSPVVTHNDTDSDTDTDSDNGFDAEKESLTGHKASCSEQSTEPTPDCDGLILNDGSEWWPTVERYKEYERCYPGVNVQREFAKMRSWCLDNPKKRKTRNGIARFVNSWLSKEQDSGTRASPYMQSIQNRVTNVDDWSAALKEKIHDSG